MISVQGHQGYNSNLVSCSGKKVEAASGLFICIVILGLLYAYTIVDAINFRVIYYQRAIFACYAAVVSMFALWVALRSSSHRAKNVYLACLGLAFLALNISVAIGSNANSVYPTDMFTDAVLVSLPIIAVPLVSKVSYFLNPKSLHVALLVLAAIYVLCVFFAEKVNNRIDTPPTLLYAALIYAGLVLSHSRIKLLWLLFTVLVCFLALAYITGSRTVLGLMIIGVCIIILARMGRVTGLVVVLLLLVVSVATVKTDQFDEDLTRKFRVKQVVDQRLDNSVQSRMEEALSVLDTMRQEWGLTELVFGAGVGATFQPANSIPDRRVRPDGRAHHIHFGPALIIYRFGLIGGAALLWIVAMVASSLIRLIRSPRLTGYAEAFYIVAMTFYLLEFPFRNILADPWLSLTFAGYIATRRRR